MKTTYFLKTLALAICFMSFGATGQWNLLGPAGITNGNTGNTQILIDGNDTPWILYAEQANNWGVSVKQWNGTSWVQVGPAVFSPAVTVQSARMAFDSNNNPFVVYTNDPGNGFTAGVKMWNGTSWVQVGPSQATTTQVAEVDIAILPSNQPIISYRDPTTNKISASVFDGTNWNLLGAAEFTPGAAYDNSLTLDALGNPYVAFRDGNAGGAGSVMTFDGISWIHVGSAGFTPGTATYIDIAIDNNGDPVVVYQDGANGQDGSAMKFNGTSWGQVGAVGFTNSTIWDVDVIVDQNNNYYFGSHYQGGPNKACAFMFDGSSWTELGALGYSAGIASSTDIALNSSDVLHAVFRDNTQSGEATAMILCGSFSTINPQSCNDYTSPSGNYVYTSTGTYFDTIPNSQNCDSIITINFTKYNSDLSANISFGPICQGDTITMSATMTGGTFFWDNGLGAGPSHSAVPSDTTTYQVIGDDGVGCIDTATVSIDVVQPVNLVYTLSDSVVCYGDTVLLTVSGAYDYYMTWPLIDSLTSQWFEPIPNYDFIIWSYDSTYTCESADTLNLVVNQGPNSAYGINGNYMYVTDNSFPIYEWYLDGNLITGATNSDYTATQNGEYTVVYYDSLGCSTSYSWTVGGIGWKEMTAHFEIYPNPFTEIISFQANNIEELLILDISGKLVARFVDLKGNVNLDLSHLETGSYTLQFYQEGVRFSKKLIKQ